MLSEIDWFPLYGEMVKLLKSLDAITYNLILIMYLLSLCVQAPRSGYVWFRGQWRPSTASTTSSQRKYERCHRAVRSPNQSASYSHRPPSTLTASSRSVLDHSISVLDYVVLPSKVVLYPSHLLVVNCILVHSRLFYYVSLHTALVKCYSLFYPSALSSNRDLSVLVYSVLSVQAFFSPLESCQKNDT